MLFKILGAEIHLGGFAKKKGGGDVRLLLF
jgi:hypothetical protein